MGRSADDFRAAVVSTTDDSALPEFPSEEGYAVFGERDKVAAALFGRGGEPGTIGRYRVGEVLGRGAMGVVYEGWDEVLQRTVAVKLISRDAELGRAEHRFRREALALAKLDHPNVVGVHEVGLHDGRLFIAMELVRGETLDAWLASRPRGWASVLEVFIQAGRGLQAAHDAGLVHRDFKPANCVVGESGRVRVLDFGLARGATDLLDEEAAATFPRASSLEVSVTRTGATLGTPAYMAPEQLRGLEVSASSDQFAFAVALYEALEGVRPFAGSCIVDIHQNIEAGRRQSGSGRTPKAILSIIERGLALSPEDRWPSVGAMVDALEAVPGRRERRRKMGWMGGMGLVAVSAVAYASVPNDPCGALPPSRVWPQPRRATIERAMDSDANWKTLDAAVSRWTGSWSETYEDVCRAAREEGRTTEATLGQQWACLERRERTVDALLQGLESAGAPAMHAGDVVRSLPSLEDCGSTEALMGVEAPPPAAASDVATVRRLLDESLVATALGDVANAVALSEAAIRLVEKIDHAPSQVDAELRRGKLGLVQDADHGEGMLRAAFVLAESTGYDVAAADAAIQLAVVEAERDALEGARRWSDVAAAKLDRINAGPRRRAVFAAVETRLALRAGDAEAADRASQEALRLCALADGESSMLCADLLSDRARVVEVVGSVDEAEAAHARAVEARRTRLGPHHPSVGAALLSRGVFLLQAGRLDAAATALDDALRILEPTVLTRALIEVHLARAQLASFRGDLSVATLDPVEALLLDFPSDDPQRADFEVVLAGFLLRLGEPQRALQVYERVLAAHERTLGRSSVELAMDGSNVGECLIALGRTSEARMRFEQALERLDDLVGEDDPRRAYPLTGLGRVLILQAEPTEAQKVLERSLAILGSDFGDPLLLAQTQWGLAQVVGLETEQGQALAKSSRANFLAADDQDSAEHVLRAIEPGRTPKGDDHE